MSTTYGQRTMQFPQRRAAVVAAGMVAAAVIAATASVAIITAQQNAPAVTRPTTVIERPAGRGEIEQAEFTGRQAAPVEGQPRGGQQEFAETR